MNIIPKNRIVELLNNSEGKKIAIVGDIMLDRYFWGTVSRISPEAPVPIIDVETESFHLGGAANVAHNLKSLGIEPILCGVLGNDNSGKIFSNIADELGIKSDYMILDDMRPTTVKTRIIGNNQHIVRLDREVKDDIGYDSEEKLLEILKNIDSLAGIILQDYNKGCITSRLIDLVINLGKDNNIPVFVDPKHHNFFNYKNVTLFKPNKKEASNALNRSFKSKEDVKEAGFQLLEKLKCKNVLITLGAEGMMLFESNGEITSIATRARNVADVSGAGDTVIATLACFYVAGASIKESAIISNYASGIVCEEPGIVSITKNNLINSF